ncbi:DinB family protein [Novosphingobium sp. Rr 2-17]|nr:DinB family protein [Novosphingobium sp. Rr 2-17]
MEADYFGQLARYNRWANARLYGAVAALPDEAYRRPIGLYFGSLHGTLNHLLGVDRLWLKRLTGEGEHPDRLDAIVHDNLHDLAQARVVEDERIIAVVSGYDASTLSRRHTYHTTSGQPQEQVLADILLHFFNHQTHHRSQAHTGLSIVTGAEPPSLDLLAFQRGAPAPDLSNLPD